MEKFKNKVCENALYATAVLVKLVLVLQDI